MFIIVGSQTDLRMVLHEMLLHLAGVPVHPRFAARHPAVVEPPLEIVGVEPCLVYLGRHPAEVIVGPKFHAVWTKMREFKYVSRQINVSFCSEFLPIKEHPIADVALIRALAPHERFVAHLFELHINDNFHFVHSNVAIMMMFTISVAVPSVLVIFRIR